MNPIRYGDACTIDLDIKYQEHILITIIHQFITNFENYIGIYVKHVISIVLSQW